MSNITSRRMERPDNNQFKEYSLNQKYYQHEAYEDKLAILVCQIKIWQPKNRDWFKIPAADSMDCLTIRECESIEITDSAKELINKAIVRFPRGTVINVRSKSDEMVKAGGYSGEMMCMAELAAATNNGELMTKYTSSYNKDGVSTTSMAVNYDDKGLIDFNRYKNEKALLSPNDIAIGNRIEIRVGYAYSHAEFEKMNRSDNGPDSHLVVAFTGFITAISVSTPLEIECTNMAHVLTTISTPNINEKNTLTVKDFLDDNGKYHLLKDTGISLDEPSRGSVINVKGGVITTNNTVADILSEWGDFGILCVMKTMPDGTSALRVGLSYYAGKDAGKLPNNNKKYITYNGGIHKVPIIQFDWDVAADKLAMKNCDKKYLAVEAQGRNKENKFFKLTIRKNPDIEDGGWSVDSGDGFQVVNKKSPKPKKSQKKSKGEEEEKPVKQDIMNKVDLSKYNKISYISTTIGISEKELIEEAKQYWAEYTPNGISGSLVIFGDLYIQPTDIVGLLDMRNPEKNGYYFVESVQTTFGVNGYRRELTIPFKIASFSNNVKIIE